MKIKTVYRLKRVSSGKYLSHLFEDNPAKAFQAVNTNEAYYWTTKELAERISSEYPWPVQTIEEQVHDN